MAEGNLTLPRAFVKTYCGQIISEHRIQALKLELKCSERPVSSYLAKVEKECRLEPDMNAQMAMLQGAGRIPGEDALAQLLGGGFRHVAHCNGLVRKATGLEEAGRSAILGAVEIGAPTYPQHPGLESKSNALTRSEQQNAHGGGVGARTG